MLLKIIPFPAYTWDSQARQYLNRGEPGGIRYERHHAGTDDRAGSGPAVDCLLHFDDRGLLDGILNHYPEASSLEEAGNVNLWVRSDRQRRGIATERWCATPPDAGT